jgi:hypothetical protein
MVVVKPLTAFRNIHPHILFCSEIMRQVRLSLDKGKSRTTIKIEDAIYLE